MLGRLIKHEWKSVYKVGCLMLGAMVLVTFFGWLAFQTPMWRSLGNGRSSFGWQDIFGAFTLLLYAVLLVVINSGIVIYVGVRFYKTMYTDEGYLLHTLPVTKHEILVSKILVGGLWVMIIFFSMYLSLFLLGMSMLWAVLPDQYTMAELWQEFRDGMGELLWLAGAELGIDFGIWFWKVLFTSLITPFVTLTTLFGAISLGQLASKHRVLTAILCYVGILIAESMISSVFGSIMTFSYLNSFGAYADRSSLAAFCVRLLTATGLYFVSWYVTSHRLNMD